MLSSPSHNAYIEMAASVLASLAVLFVPEFTVYFVVSSVVMLLLLLLFLALLILLLL